MRRWAVACAAMALVGAVAARAGDYEQLEEELMKLPAQCQVPTQNVADGTLLRRSAARVEREQIFRIVVLGTATAQGVGASSPDRSWPLRLEALMRERYPTTNLRVVVKAKAYDNAQKMVARLDEVLAERPHLVIWETGTAEAVRGLNIEEFVATLRAGIDRVAETRADIILVEPQYARRTSLLINYGPYLEAIRQAGQMRGLIVFPRYAVMKHWANSEQIVVDNLPASMVAETADKVYDCLARLLAIQISYGMRRNP
ncbi:MAG: hypothetical protein JNK67_05015 [Alphaproteobacteria bacterium]|nr:hypothetical protein [Alphaproteobacteria bacterium]